MLRRVGHDLAVAHAHEPRGRGADGIVVGHHHERETVVVEAAQELHDLARRLGVERAGWLVGPHDPRLRGERARDRRALLLTARQLRGSVLSPVAQPDPLQEPDRIGFHSAKPDAVEQPPTTQPDAIPATIGTRPDDAEPGEQIQILYVRTVRGVKSFRRAGFAFDETGMGLDRAMLTDEQVEALMNEPKLNVEEGFIDAAEE